MSDWSWWQLLIFSLVGMVVVYLAFVPVCIYYARQRNTALDRFLLSTPNESAPKENGWANLRDFGVFWPILLAIVLIVHFFDSFGYIKRAIERKADRDLLAKQRRAYELGEGPNPVHPKPNGGSNV